jgi:ribose 5-phosphate isomerase A
MTIGLGTGSTATFFIREVARRIQTEGLKVDCVASSIASTLLARSEGISLVPMEQVSHVDLYVDGADEVAPDKGLIKGRGAAMLGEKILVEACDEFLVIADQGKLVDALGMKFPVPVAMIPQAIGVVQARIAALGAKTTLRPAGGKDGPVVTDQGHVVLDAIFPPGSDWKALDAALNAIPGVAGHGLFLRWTGKTKVLVGGGGKVREIT